MIVGRCVPYGEVGRRSDDGAGPYREMFAKGAFRQATKAPNRVLLSFEHQVDPLNLLGQGVELVERDDGLHGTFKVFDGNVGDQGLAMVREGVLTGMSVRALVIGRGRRQGDVVVRTNCRLDHVALCREPAYAGAVVEALRCRPVDRAGGAVPSCARPATSSSTNRLRALGIVANANAVCSFRS